ncbi:glycosyl hydrolase [Frigoribacterium sp. 2-23]|uniref:glycosyl hydrolase n=1 Tax=Frigoribacterium sp. 2-23 TaxID=3415006 RepID=UPI003C6F2406
MSESSQNFVTPLHVHSGVWWATSKGNARRTALGATAIAVLLAMITWLIWVSPSENAVRTAVQQAVGAPTTTDIATLKADRSALLDQLLSAKTQLTASKTALAEVQQKAWSSEAQLTEAKAQLASAQASVSALENAAGSGSGSNAAGAAGSAAKGATGGSGSVSPGKTGSTGGTTGPVTITAPTKAQIVNPTSRYFGLYTTQSPFSWSEFDDVSQKVKAQPNLAGYFQGWDQDFNPAAVNRAWAKGDLSLLTWESRPISASNSQVTEPDYELGKIIDGAFDDYLTRYADAIVANGLPLAIRLNHEMNGNWYPWDEGVNNNAKGDYVKMWQHVHDIFADRGANDLVAWVWAPTRAEGVPTANRTLEYTKSLYPGDEYVDWVGMTGYLRSSPETQQPGDFDGTFGKTLGYLRQITHKPILLAEIGAAELGSVAQAQKPKWIASLFDTLADPKNADIIGFAWFNLTATTVSSGSYLTNDWRIVSRQDSIDAFTAGIARTDTGFSLRRQP